MASFQTCEFSDAIEQSNGLVNFSSHRTNYIAAASGNKLVIRDANSLEVIQIYSCIDKIERLEWAPDGQYLFCVMILRSAVQVFSVADAKWTCRINEGVAGLVSAKWSPDSRHIILESDFGIHLSIWSLLDGSSQLILHPKPNTFSTTPSMIAFSNCSR
jgi:tricorn protease-like protein